MPCIVHPALALNDAGSVAGMARTATTEAAAFDEDLGDYLVGGGSTRSSAAELEQK